MTPPSKRYYYLSFVLALLVIAAFITGRCSQPDPPPHSNKDSLTIVDLRIEAEVAELKNLAKGQSDTVIKERHHYHTIRHDSLIPCEDKLTLADTIILHDSIHDVTQDLIIAKQDTVIYNQNLVINQDSVVIIGLRKEVKKQKWQKRWIIAAWILREGLGFVGKR